MYDTFKSFNFIFICWTGGKCTHIENNQILRYPVAIVLQLLSLSQLLFFLYSSNPLSHIWQPFLLSFIVIYPLGISSYKAHIVTHISKVTCWKINFSIIWCRPFVLGVDVDVAKEDDAVIGAVAKIRWSIVWPHNEIAYLRIGLDYRI